MINIFIFPTLIWITVAEDSDPNFFVAVVSIMDSVSAANSDQRQENQGLHGYLMSNINFHKIYQDISTAFPFFYMKLICRI